MKGTVLNADTIVADDGKYYHFNEDEFKNSIAAIGDRVRFKPDETDAKNIFVIDPNDTQDISDNESSAETQEPKRSEESIKAAKDYETLSVAKWQGLLSAIIPAAINIYILFFGVTSERQDVLNVISTGIAMALTYMALKNIADISRNPDMHTNYAKSMFILIGGLVALIVVAKILDNASSGVATALKVGVLALIGYVFMIQFRVFSELARLTRNGLFRRFIIFYMSGLAIIVMDPLSIIGSLLIFVSFFIYVFAWKNTYEVADVDDLNRFVYS